MPATDAVVVRAGEGETIEGPAGGPLTFKVRGEQTDGRLAGMERFFDRFAALPAFDPGAFAAIGSEVGMDVIGPPLAQQE